MSRVSIGFRTLVVALLLLCLFLNFVGYGWVISVVGASLLITAVAMRIWKKWKEISFVVACLCLCFAVVQIFAWWSSRCWERQFLSIKSANQVELISVGETENEWSSGGYSYARYFKIKTVLDSSNVATWFAHALQSPIKSREEFEPFSGFVKESVRVDVERIEVWANRNVQFGKNEHRSVNSMSEPNFVISVNVDVQDGN